MLISTLSLVCMVAGILYSVPQVLKVVRARTAAGVSLLAWQLLAATSSAWTIHGILGRDQAVIWANVAGVVSSILLLGMMIRERHLGIVRTLWLPVVLLAVLVGIRIGISPLLFGAVIVVPQLAAQSGQFFELVRATLLDGVSPGFLWCGVVLQGLWVAYGLLVHDSAILVASASTGALCLLNVVWFYLRHTEVVRPHPGFARRTVADALDPDEADPEPGIPVG